MCACHNSGSWFASPSIDLTWWPWPSSLFSENASMYLCVGVEQAAILCSCCLCKGLQHSRKGRMAAATRISGGTRGCGHRRCGRQIQMLKQQEEIADLSFLGGLRRTCPLPLGGFLVGSFFTCTPRGKTAGNPFSFPSAVIFFPLLPPLSTIKIHTPV